MKTTLAILALLALAGCGSQAQATLTTTPEQAVTAAATIYISTLMQGDGKGVYAMWSERCKKTKTEAEVESNANFGPLYSAAKMLDQHAAVTGKTAKLYQHWDTPALNKEGQSWVNEGGWKWDGC